MKRAAKRKPRTPEEANWALREALNAVLVETEVDRTLFRSMKQRDAEPPEDFCYGFKDAGTRLTDALDRLRQFV